MPASKNRLRIAVPTTGTVALWNPVTGVGGQPVSVIGDLQRVDEAQHRQRVQRPRARDVGQQLGNDPEADQRGRRHLEELREKCRDKPYGGLPEPVVQELSPNLSLTYATRDPTCHLTHLA